MSVLDLFRLDGKKAVVTGASSGIGKRVALAYAQAGAEVAIAARHSEALDEVTREIAAAGAGEVLPISCDVTRPEHVERMVEHVTGELGGIDIAVCNAGSVTLCCAGWPSSAGALFVARPRRLAACSVRNRPPPVSVYSDGVAPAVVCGVT